MSTVNKLPRLLLLAAGFVGLLVPTRAQSPSAVVGPPSNAALLAPNGVDLAQFANKPFHAAQASVKCDGVTDDTAGLQTASNYATSLGRQLAIDGTSKGCIISASLAVTGTPNIKGDGAQASYLINAFNGPAITWTTPAGQQVDKYEIQGLGFRGGLAAGATAAAQRGILILGDSTPASHGRFHNMTFEGEYAAIEVNKTCGIDANGCESPLAWTAFDDLNVIGGANPAVIGIQFDQGSGTGNTISRMKTGMSTAGGAIIAFLNNVPASNTAAQGAVVGDVLIDGGHFGSSVPGTTLVSVASGTCYRANIAITGSQMDANVDSPFNLASDTTCASYSHITLEGNNYGGSFKLSMPPNVSRSVIHDSDVSEWSSGNGRYNIPAPGNTNTQTVPVYLINDGDPWAAIYCSIDVSGFVQAVAGGLIHQEIIFYRNGGTPLAAGVQVSRDSTGGASGFFGLTFAAIAGTSSGTLNVTYNPANNAGSYFTTNLVCHGGSFAITRQ